MVTNTNGTGLEQQARISWRDVIDLSPENINRLQQQQQQAGEKVTSVTFHSPEQLQQISNALDIIEQTELGQQLLRGILAKQLNPDYANGAYNGQRVSVIAGGDGLSTIAAYAGTFR